MSTQPNSCDDCGRARSTLYRKARGLVCYYCLPVEDLSGVRALRTIKAAVTGAVNVERRRRTLEKRCDSAKHRKRSCSRSSPRG